MLLEDLQRNHQRGTGHDRFVHLFGNDDRVGEDENDGSHPEGAIPRVGLCGNGGFVGYSGHISYPSKSTDTIR